VRGGSEWFLTGVAREARQDGRRGDVGVLSPMLSPGLARARSRSGAVSGACVSCHASIDRRGEEMGRARTKRNEL
jgi:hypothetical protein